MRVANLNGRAVIVVEDGAVDIAEASGLRFGPDPMAVLADWPEFAAWAGTVTSTGELPDAKPFGESELGAPVPHPAQVFALLTNYPAAAALPGMSVPKDLIVLTKFASSLTGPFAEISLHGPMIDYETSVVLVIGKGGLGIAAEDAWDHVAGIAIGQDLSDRTTMLLTPAPQQFSLAKSFPGAGPFGPYIVTPDEFADRDAIAFHATLEGPGINGVVTVQEASTAELIFGVPEIIARLSRTVKLLPGDLIFTGTPGGIGLARGMLLRPGLTLTSTLDGAGSTRNTFTSDLDPFPAPPPPPPGPPPTL